MTKIFKIALLYYYEYNIKKKKKNCYEYNIYKTKTVIILNIKK